MGICFVGECWVAVTGLGTQSHLYYAMLEYATKGTKVVALIRKDLVDSVQLVVATMQAVVVAVGGYRIGGIYEKCSVGVHAIQDYVGLLTGWIGGGDWVLLGIWNAHHHTWSLDGRSGPSGRVLAEWVQERGAEIHFGEGGMFERRRRGGVVQSRIDLVVSLPDSRWTGENDDWLLSDHASINESLVVGKVGRVDEREVIDCDKLLATLEDENEGWYWDLVRETAYDNLLNLQQKHLKKLRVCGRSKRRWSGKIAAQLAVVRLHCRRLGPDED